MLTYTTHKNQWRQSFLVHLLSTSNNVIHTDAINTTTSIKRASNGTHIHKHIHRIWWIFRSGCDDTYENAIINTHTTNSDIHDQINGNGEYSVAIRWIAAWRRFFAHWPLQLIFWTEPLSSIKNRRKLDI